MAVALTLAVSGLVGCGTGVVETPTRTVTTVVTTSQTAPTPRASAPPRAVPPPQVGAPVDARSTEAFDRIAQRLPAGSGLAVAPVGQPDEVRVAGELVSDVAWSTVKVPLAIAALRVAPDLEGVAEQAITVSDNTAAETLWSALGGAPGAAADVEAVMAEAGDSRTRVPTSRLRPGYSVFGQTEWGLGEQARFGSGLACLPDGGPVLHMMSRIDPSQRWGLGHVPGAAFKGGWGPTVDAGGYLVRQFGMIPTRSGGIAVAIAAYGPDMDTGAARLTSIAEGIAAEVEALSAGSCP